MSSNPDPQLSWPLLAQPHPVARPTVGADFFQLPGWRRSLTAILYNLRCLEHWIAPQGWIREWFRLNVLAAVLIGTSSLLVGPVVSALLVNVAQWTQLSVVILTEVMSVVAILPPLLFSVVSGIFLWKVIKRNKNRTVRPNSNPNYYE